MKRADRLVVIIAIIMAAVLFAAGFLIKGGHKAAVVRVSCDNELKATYSLLYDGEYDIDTAYGHNHLSIKAGCATVTEADCPGGDCMRMGPVTAEGGAIICAPHRLYIGTEENDGEADALSR